MGAPLKLSQEQLTRISTQLIESVTAKGYVTALPGENARSVSQKQTAKRSVSRTNKRGNAGKSLSQREARRIFANAFTKALAR